MVLDDEPLIGISAGKVIFKCFCDLDALPWKCCQCHVHLWVDKFH